MNRFSPNALGAIFMMFSMAGFVLNDTMMKMVMVDMNIFQAILLRGLVACSLMFILCWKTGAFKLPGGAMNAARNPMVVVRSLCETAAAYFFLTALTHMPIGNVTAVLQILPLTITLGAALFFGEKVGWRRYLAIAVGFFGVMLIIQPGTENFNSFAIYALFATAFVTVRDLTTKRIPKETPSLLVGLVTAIAIMMLGAIGSISVSWQPASIEQISFLTIAAILLMVGNVCSVLTMRHGEVGFTAPFRYSVLIWALILGYFVFGEIPNNLALLGAAIVVGSGLFTFYREQKLARKLNRDTIAAI